MITELRLRDLKNFLADLCPLHGTVFALSDLGDRVAEVVCQYEGYAQIVKGLLRKQENIAKLSELGYNKLIVRLGNRPKPIAIVKAWSCPL